MAELARTMTSQNTLSALQTRLCKSLARSRIFSGARRLWAQNQQDFRLPLTPPQKLWVTLYLLLEDRGAGRLPGRAGITQAQAHAAESDYPDQLGNMSRAELDAMGLLKPFWREKEQRRFLEHYLVLLRWLARNGIQPPARLVETGCGAGWITELLALSGYHVLGTTLDEKTVELARTRLAGIKQRRPDAVLEFRQAAMESLSEATDGWEPAKVVYLYEALHHVHDPKRGIEEAFQILAPGGILLILNEPARLHTFRAYRVARLTGTHEIGLSARLLRRSLHDAGFQRICTIKHRGTFGFRPLWMAAWKPG